MQLKSSEKNVLLRRRSDTLDDGEEEPGKARSAGRALSASAPHPDDAPGHEGVLGRLIGGGRAWRAPRGS